MIIALYVDDLLIFSNHEAERKNVKKVLSSEFEMKDLGHVKKVLGVRVRKEDGMIKLDQEEHIEKLLQKFGMSNCNILLTVMDVNCSNILGE
jgi:hypothetical protein